MPPKKSEVAEAISEHEFAKFTNDIKTMIKDVNKDVKDVNKKIGSLDDKLSSKLKNLDDRFSSFFEELKDDISAVKNDMTEVTTDVVNMKSQLDEVEKSMDFHASKVDQVEKEQDEKREKMNKELNEKIEELNNKLMMLEKHDRKYNLIFYGIGEERNEKLYEKMRYFFTRHLKVEEEKAKEIHFSNGHRLPTDSKFKGPKPVIMRFSSYEDRELVISRAYHLAGSDMRILTDLPVQMKKERARLAKIAYDIRQQEKLKTRIKDRGLEVTLEVRKNDTEKWMVRTA